jgi:hypothetical protein
VTQFVLPIDIVVPQPSSSRAPGGLASVAPQTLSGVKLTVRVIDSMSNPEFAAQIQWLNADEALSVYSLSPFLAVCTNTRCLIIRSTLLGSNGPSLSPPASPRGNSDSSNLSNIPFHPSLGKLFSASHLIKMGIDVTTLISEVQQLDRGQTECASFLELQSISSLVSNFSGVPMVDPLDTILQLLVYSLILVSLLGFSFFKALFFIAFSICDRLLKCQSTRLAALQISSIRLPLVHSSCSVSDYVFRKLCHSALSLIYPPCNLRPSPNPRNHSLCAFLFLIFNFK